jgi:FdrA protein
MRPRSGLDTLRSPVTTLEQIASAVRSFVLPNTYRDSVELMRVAAELEARPGIQRAALVIATSANRDVLLAAGLLSGDALTAGPNDLVVAIAGEAGAVDDAQAEARALLSGRATQPARGARQSEPPHTLAEGLDEMPDANLALISTPGTFATAEALKALKHGLDVFLFSDNVSVEDELELKALARRKGLLLMGPDCGTAILGGVPLGFANAVQAGAIGLIGASGTGLQEVACLIDRRGEGISGAIGVGGRDLDERIGGTMMLAALERLAADDLTRVIVLVSKPAAPAVATRVLARARQCGKSVVVNFLGAEPRPAEDNLVFADTLDAAAACAVALARGEPLPDGPAALSDELVVEVRAQAGRLAVGTRRIVGLYSGGTLCKEASHVLHQLLPGAEHDLVDLGDDEFTVGRPHPMIDARLRSERIVDVGAHSDVGVLLLDVVLGYGSHPDPAGGLIEAIAAARQAASRAGRYLAVVGSVCGTPGDPQNLADQQAKLRGVGVVLAPSNEQAARVAALIAGAPG